MPSPLNLKKKTAVPHTLIPLGAMMLCAGALAQSQPATGAEHSLKQITVTDTTESGKDSIRATTTTTGKGTQALRDIPQSITVVTEKLMDDRNLDTLKDVLHNTAGVTFQAAEGGEEDIRLRGFSLANTGDIFLDGMRDPAFYDRDTFNLDRVDLLRGSASMLFGRGSTGGAVNQVSKLPHLYSDHEAGVTLGNHNYHRSTGDFNWKTGQDAALRLNLMHTQAANNGSGSGVDKYGLAAAFRWGIGTRDEFLLSASLLDNKNPRMNYGLPYVRFATQSQADNTVLPGLDPSNYYGLASDRNTGTAKNLLLSHTHRFAHDSQLKTQLRKGVFTRDQRASAIRSAGLTLDNFGPETVLTRGTNLKVQDVDVTQLQSDFSAKFNALGLKHELLTGIDISRENKIVFLARTAAQGGVTITKPTTLAGTPNDGASINEDSRSFRTGNDFSSNAIGIYAQDLVHLTPQWKLLGGLRYDSMKGSYNQYAIPVTAVGPETTTRYEQKISEWSKRIGLLYQPNALQSYHFSYGTSFNTSGDSYSYNAQSANTPPEQSRNIEFGAKIDSADKRLSTRYAIFWSEKSNERNTDPDSAATQLLLSGKRHAAGVEVDVTGRITPQWEVYGSYVWMPVAKVDEAASTATAGGARKGDRPGLTPKHSGTVWTTYQATPQWRVGGGVNFRSKQSPADIGNPALGIWNAASFATLDLLLEYRIDDKSTIKTNLSNVTNKYYADVLYRGHYVPGFGRLLQVNYTARF